MVDELPIPKTIVVPSRAYVYCMELFLGDVLSESSFGWVWNSLKNEELTELDPSERKEAMAAIERILGFPWYVRQGIAAQRWESATARAVVRHVLRLRSIGERIPLLRVNPREAFAWFRNRPRPAVKLDEASREICLSLIHTYDYFSWERQLGDQDVARWIARSVERKMWPGQ